jgi:hypothetical protein
MSRAPRRKRTYGSVFLLACILTLGLGSGALATTVCDTDPDAVPYTPTVNPDRLNALLDTLGSIDIDYVFNVPVSLLFSHTLNLSMNSAIDLAGVDFIVTPGLGTLEVELAIPAWSTSLSTSMSHAACRNCGSEYNSCLDGCDDDYDDCCDYFGCELICVPILVACDAGCLGALGLCEPVELACEGEGAAIDLLLGGNNFGMSFASASLTQTADICVEGNCRPSFPAESTVADLSGFSFQLFPETDILGVGEWVNDLITGLINWIVDIENTIADFFETPDGQGVLVLPFAFDIYTDGCLPPREVIDCIAGGCSTVERPKGRIGRGANLVFYVLPVAFLLGISLWSRRR